MLIVTNNKYFWVLEFRMSNKCNFIFWKLIIAQKYNCRNSIIFLTAFNQYKRLRGEKRNLIESFLKKLTKGGREREGSTGRGPIFSETAPALAYLVKETTKTLIKWPAARIELATGWIRVSYFAHYTILVRWDNIIKSLIARNK